LLAGLEIDCDPWLVLRTVATFISLFWGDEIIASLSAFEITMLLLLSVGLINSLRNKPQAEELNAIRIENVEQGNGYQHLQEEEKEAPKSAKEVFYKYCPRFNFFGAAAPPHAVELEVRGRPEI
jgi:hypothetical protein